MSNAANRKDIRAAEKRIAATTLVNREVICGLMQISNGRQWVWERLEEAAYFTTTFSPDAAIHAFNAGQRMIATRLFNDIMTYCPEQFTTMMREAHERSTATERAGSQNADRGIEGRDIDGAAGSDYYNGPDGDPDGDSGSEAFTRRA